MDGLQIFLGEEQIGGHEVALALEVANLLFSQIHSEFLGAQAYRHSLRAYV